MRAIGVDYGRVRLGLALSDEEGTLASPLPTKTSSGWANAPLDELVELIRRERIDRAVVGLPLHMNGTEGEMAAEARSFAERLAKAASIPVDLLDERGTSQEASRILHEAGASRKDRRGLRDAVAAVQILQCYLDRTRGQESSERGRR